MSGTSDGPITEIVHVAGAHVGPLLARVEQRPQPLPAGRQRVAGERPEHLAVTKGDLGETGLRPLDQVAQPLAARIQHG